MNPYLLTLIFIVSSVIGYFLIKQVPALLHTPLMSGTNALSGLTIIGAITAAGSAVYLHNQWLGYIAVFFAMINVAGGFGVTERMLNMFKSGKEKNHE